MLIRSQNKRSLTNLNTIAALAIHEGIGNRYHISTVMPVSGGKEPMRVIIATYSTQAKAIKVLDMIEEQYLDFCCNYHAKSGVFQMPADEEVEV